MPNELTDLELDEVSLVGKAANGRKYILIKSREGVPMTKTEPARADKAGARASVTKADLEAMISGAVRKAVEPIAEENRVLKSIVERQTSLLEDKEFVAIAKSDFSELGSPEEVAPVLKSLKSMKPEERKPIIQMLKRTNAMRKEAGKLLYSPLGSSRPVPGTPADVFNAAVEERLAQIQKSADAPKDAKLAHAMATTWVTKNKPELFRALTGGE